MSQHLGLLWYMFFCLFVFFFFILFLDTICMKCQRLFSGKNMEKIKMSAETFYPASQALNKIKAILDIFLICFLANIWVLVRSPSYFSLYEQTDLGKILTKQVNKATIHSFHMDDIFEYLHNKDFN